MTLPQIVLSILIFIDLFITWYAIIRKMNIDDSYFKIQKSSGIKGVTIIKLIVGVVYVYTLPKPTFSQYGAVIAVPAYGFFVLLLMYNFWKALKNQ
jgi:multisubunit Na+/H+ antiporter MnhG subunit